MKKIDLQQSSNDKENNYLKEKFTFSKDSSYVVKKIINENKEYEVKLPIPEETSYEDPQETFEKKYLRSKEAPEYKDPTGNIRVVDLFSGCGGLSLGVKEACSTLGFKFSPVLTVDEDSEVLDVYEDNFESAKSKCGDISQMIDGKFGEEITENEEEILNEIDDVDLLLSGPPCQGHSNLNNHSRRSDMRNALYGRVIRFAEIVEPTHIIIENVPQVRLDEDKILQRSVDHLRKQDGYYISNDVVDLSDIGVPQERERHLLIASKEKSVNIQKIIEKHEVNKKRNLEWAIGDLKDETGESRFKKPTDLAEQNEERIDYLFDNDLYDLPNHKRPTCHQDGHNYKSMYGRLKWDEPAPTITTGFLSPGQGRYIHPKRRRVLIPHEAARIQYFPDFFDFEPASTRDGLKKMIGNAVPPKVGYVLGLELLA